jgi:hypothetical protein
MRTHLPAFSKLTFAFVISFITIEATAQPKVNSFTPVKGPLGTTVTISGTGFNTTAANNIVFFGAVKASVSAASATSLSVTVPPGATYQPISVLDNTSGLTGYSNKPFITTFSFTGSGIPANFYKPKVDFVTGSLPRNAVISDLDGDGKSEIIVANGSAGTISVLRNISAPGNILTTSFEAKVDFVTGNFTDYAIASDVDGDGKPDLVFVYSGRIGIMRNTASTGGFNASSFAAKIDITPLFGGTSFVATADLDDDGKPELVSANAVNTISVVRNTSTPGTISFATKVDFPSPGTASSIAIGDVDGDSKLDIMVTNAAGGTNTVSVFRNTSTTGVINGTSFAAKVDFAVGPTPRSVAFGDIDGDGKPDMVVANSDATNTTISVLRNTATSGVINASSFAAKVDFTTGLGPRSVAIDDVNGDGKLDVVVANFNAKTMSVFNNTATSGSINASSLAGKVDFVTGNGPVSIVIGDLNGDGVAESIIGTGSNDNTASVYQIDLSTVPVSLTGIKAHPKNQGVLFEWTAQQESGILSYEIERSQDGQHFSQIGSVPAKGNSSLAINYHWFDANPIAGTNFYRLKIIEAGQQSYSGVIKVNFANTYVNKIAVYPNPIKDNTISIQMALPKGKYKISLTNKIGQRILNRVIDHKGGDAIEKIYFLNTLVPGVYQITITGEGISSTRQVIKN